MSWVSDLVMNVEGSSSERDLKTIQSAFHKPPSNFASKRISCDVCRKTFDKLSLLVTHIVVYHGRCEDNSDLEKTELPKASRRRPRSGRAKQNRLYMVHKYFATNKPFTCDACTRCFAYKFQLIDHLESHKERIRYGCDVCKREFHDEEHLMAHLHTKPYDPLACDLCGQKFSSWSLLSYHRLEHLSVVKSRSRIGDVRFVRNEWERRLREILEVKLDAQEFYEELVDRATGVIQPPAKVRGDYRHYMRRIRPDALNRTEPYPTCPCPKELPSSVRDREITEIQRLDPSCYCEPDTSRGHVRLLLTEMTPKEKAKLLPSEVRELEELRRCKCDAMPSPPTPSEVGEEISATDFGGRGPSPTPDQPEA